MRLKIKGAALLAAALLAGGCARDMKDGARLKPYEKSGFFEDGGSSRQPVEGTVPRGALREDAHFYTGRAGGGFAETFPFEVTGDVLRRGRERYAIFCSMCHGLTGDGRGMVVQRGFKAPQTFHSDRLRQAPPGYFFDVMTRGFGVMPGYSAQVPAADRWAIAAYLRALQLSQNAKLEDASPADRARLEASGEGRP
jgi:mono/diheme cytochrome c family protein